jgi:hypothetical protein
MNKKSTHHRLTSLRHIKVRYLLLAAVIFGLISVAALRHNTQRMSQLRQAVFPAAEQNGDVEKALENLRGYVTGHMNTSLTSASNGVYPPIQLKYTYDRLVTAAGSQTGAANDNVYNDAQKACEAQIPTGFSGRYRLDCIEQYVEAHGGAPVSSIPDSLYKFDFVSPTWSPDLAGFSLLATLFCLLATAVLAGYRYYLRRSSK